MKYRTLLITSLAISFSVAATAQTTDTAEPIDEIVVTATKQMDPAMSAFLAGDFETAEFEFERNAFCALRVERNFRAGVESARESSITADVASDAVSSPIPSGGPDGGGAGVVVQAAPSSVPNISVNSSDFQKNETSNARTCENRGYQTYMMGLSQLKLGKRDEAKAAFKRATSIHRTLYDAQFRLSLMEYQDGNIKNAKKRYKTLQKIAARCKRCEAKDEIEGQVQYLKTLLK